MLGIFWAPVVISGDTQAKNRSPYPLLPPSQNVAAIRRRLSVAGGETSLDGGIERLSVAEGEEGAVSGTDSRCAVTEYSGLSKKGHAPYNPRKKNQDSLIMADHEGTNSLVLCVLDGHGEAGDGVSQWFKKELAKEMFNHPSWVDDPKKATKDAILKVEQQILRNSRVDTEFSGTTLSMAIIRGNTIIGVNIGDSRVTIGKLGPDGKIVAEEVSGVGVVGVVGCGSGGDCGEKPMLYLWCTNGEDACIISNPPPLPTFSSHTITSPILPRRRRESSTPEVGSLLLSTTMESMDPLGFGWVTWTSLGLP